MVLRSSVTKNWQTLLEFARTLPSEEEATKAPATTEDEVPTVTTDDGDRPATAITDGKAPATATAAPATTNGGDRGRVGGDDPGGDGLGDSVELGEQLLARVVAQVGQGQAHAQEQAQHPGPERRQVGVIGENGLVRAHNLTPRDSCATIRHGGLPNDTHPIKTP